MILKKWDIPLNADDILRGQGVEPTIIHTRRPALLEYAEWALGESLPLLEPVVLAEFKDVMEIRHERLVLSNGGYLTGKLLVQHLMKAKRIAIILCTIGSQLETISNQLFQTDPMYALALEGAGTAAVETLANQACRYYEDWAASKGWKTSIPLSPGMVGWPVETGQAQIFNLIDASQAGVSMNNNYMMTPRMSLTQILGFGEEMDIQGRTCDYCNLKETCRYQDHYAIP
jgi:hypothetical protein